MAIEYSVTKHTYCNPGNILASDYGAHMVSLAIEEPTDNGRIVGVDKMTSLDQWSIAETEPKIDAYIALKGVDGTYLVVVDKVYDEKTALIYQQPIINEESPKMLTSLHNFFNDPEDGPVRGYILQALDRFWLSEEGFDLGAGVDGTATKELKPGATISAISDGKLVID